MKFRDYLVGAILGALASTSTLFIPETELRFATMVLASLLTGILYSLVFDQ